MWAKNKNIRACGSETKHILTTFRNQEPRLCLYDLLFLSLALVTLYEGSNLTGASYEFFNEKDYCHWAGHSPNDSISSITVIKGSQTYLQSFREFQFG